MTAVHYPGVDEAGIDGAGIEKTTLELARRQMPDGFGPLLSFEVTPDSAETAPSGLIRLSVGVEPAADLITDIDDALEVL